ncbi:MAG: leucine-rich repeat domain-containing protein [Muribaculaceae bacterium]
MKHPPLPRLLVVLLLALTASAASAYSFEVNGIYYNRNNNGTSVSVTYRNNYYHSYTGSVTIPEQVTYSGTTYSVTSIGESAFYLCSDLTSVTIPNSVTSIGSSAFSGCTGLTSVTIPNSVTSIGGWAFSDCSGLTSVTIPNSVTSIGKWAFYGCSGLTSVAIPNSVTSIGDQAFRNCSGLTSVTIPNSVTSIGDYAFSDCSGLESIVVASGNSIYDSRNNCDAIIETSTNTLLYGCKNTIIPNSVTSIGNYAFGGCSGLTSVTIPNSITSIGTSAFSNCSGLTSVTIDNSVTSIGISAFSDCSGLVNMTLPKSVTSIGASAFANCSALKSVVFGAGLTSIGSDAFSGCSIKKAFWFPNTPPSGSNNISASVHYVANDQYSFSNQTKYQFLSSMFTVDGTVYVPVSPSERTCDVIDCTYSPDNKEIVISDKVSNRGVELSVLSINPYSYIYNTHIESVLISNNGEIGNYAFIGCTALQTATVSNQGNLGEGTFYGCTALQTATVSNQGNVGYKAFYGCPALQTATISNQGSVGASAFSGCTSLQTASISNQGSVEASAFSGCSSLATVTLGEEVTGIGENAFYNCSALGEIVIPDAVTAVGASAFKECAALENVSIGKGMTSLPQRVFYGCSSLTSLTIPNNVASVADYAFGGCTALSDLTIEDADITDSTEEVPTELSFDDWTSTNHNNSSTSYKEYTFVVQAGSVLTFNYSVSSESGYDFLIIKLNGTQIVKESGSKSGSYRKEFTEAGTYTLYLSYTKDSSNSSGSDQATVTEIYLSIGYIIDSLNLGSNGSSPLFVDCPLDEVYIGRKLNYSTASDAGYSPFYRNTYLRMVEITDAETQIYDNEFYGCTNLQTLKIGNGVKTIGKWAFSGCSAMTYFSVGSNVESIGQEAFSDCTGLTSFYSNSAVPPTCGDQALDDINKWECILYVIDDCIAAYQAADQWKEFFYIYSSNEDVTIDGGVEVCLDGGVLHCGGADTVVYTLSGVPVYIGCGDVELAAGAYIVVANGRATKVVVK